MLTLFSFLACTIQVPQCFWYQPADQAIVMAQLEVPCVDLYLANDIERIV